MEGQFSYGHTGLMYRQEMKTATPLIKSRCTEFVEEALYGRCSLVPGRLEKTGQLDNGYRTHEFFPDRIMGTSKTEHGSIAARF